MCDFSRLCADCLQNNLIGCTTAKDRNQSVRLRRLGILAITMCISQEGHFPRPNMWGIEDFLKFCMLGKPKSTNDIVKCFLSFFYQTIGSQMTCKFSPKETVWYVRSAFLWKYETRSVQVLYRLCGYVYQIREKAGKMQIISIFECRMLWLDCASAHSYITQGM